MLPTKIKEIELSRHKELLKLRFSSKILDEYDQAAENRPSFHSLHEAYAILLEEVDELWLLIKQKPYPQRMGQIQAEAIQVSATALRLLVDCTDDAEITKE